MEFVNRHTFIRLGKSLIKSFYVGVCVMFETLGLAISCSPIGMIFDAETWGSWEYYSKRVPIYNEWTESYDRDINITFRKSSYTGRHQYWSQNPCSNFIGGSGWDDVPEEGIKLRIYKN